MKRNKGFTIIELLVVISLIGLMSFIVLTSLNNAREKGLDVQLQSLFASLRAQSERYYNKYNTFYFNPEDPNTLCGSDLDHYGFGGAYGPGLLHDLAEIFSIGYKDIQLTNSDAGAWNKITCHAKDNAWVVEAPMSDSKGEDNPVMYCMDSTGLSQINRFNIEGSLSNGENGLSCTLGN